MRSHVPDPASDTEPVSGHPSPAFSSDATLTLRPIGYIRSGKHVKFAARHQPDEREAEENFLELLPDAQLALATADLSGFDRVWLLWWFHRNTGWRPQVIPPRGPQKRRGVFATRSPHRPNALGLTPVRLFGVERGGRLLRLGPCDLVEGTPVFDIKPYVPAYDSFPESRAGWIDEVDAAERMEPRFVVELSPRAEEQAEWLRETWNIDFLPRVRELLGRDPSPHRTRRIRRVAVKHGGGAQIGCGAWRAMFRVDEVSCRVVVTGLGPAYPLWQLRREGAEVVPDRDAQEAFLRRWPDAELPLQAPPRGRLGQTWADAKGD
jgi:putative methyltransferase, YaeB/AF_0241 family